MDYVIGCDIGSQGVKAILVSLDGKICAEVSSTYDIQYPRPAWAEQSAAAWQRGVEDAVRRLVRSQSVQPDQVRAIGLDAQVDGFVAVDDHGAPLRPAIIWMDRRAVSQCEAAASNGGAESIARQSGLNLDASHVAPKIRWLAENEPAIYERAARFLLPASFVGLALTGEAGVDYSNASSTLLMDIRSRTWSPELCARFQIDPARLAPIRPATAVLGPLSRAAAESLGLTTRTIVMVGSGDEHAACLGAGVTEAGLACDIAGTAEPVCAASATPAIDETGLVETHCHAEPQLWLLENPGFVSGANYRWFRDQFGAAEVEQARRAGGDPYEILNAAAASVPAGSEGLILLPCLMGAMTPTWNAAARGTFLGFTLAHRREHFVRAVLEASAYAVRDISDRMQAMGLALKEIRVVGGGARSRLWRQIKADVTGLPISVPQTVETTSLGAAMLGLVGAGAFGSLAQAAERVVHVAETLEPRPAERRRYDEYYQVYRDAYFALAPVFERASRIEA